MKTFTCNNTKPHADYRECGHCGMCSEHCDTQKPCENKDVKDE